MAPPVRPRDALDLTTRLKGCDHQELPLRQRSASAVTSFKAVPEEHGRSRRLLTFSPNDRDGLNLNTVSDIRYVPISVHYSFLELPAEPMQPRLVDDRWATSSRPTRT
jgi:hypothetical protein